MPYNSVLLAFRFPPSIAPRLLERVRPPTLPILPIVQLAAPRTQSVPPLVPPDVPRRTPLHGHPRPSLRDGPDTGKDWGRFLHPRWVSVPRLIELERGRCGRTVGSSSSTPCGSFPTGFFHPDVPVVRQRRSGRYDTFQLSVRSRLLYDGRAG
jgi:hypothetical protein